MLEMTVKHHRPLLYGIRIYIMYVVSDSFIVKVRTKLTYLSEHCISYFIRCT